MMSVIIPLILATLPLTISPGPANTMYAASGAQFGIRKTLPLWAGINLICIIQTLAVGFGVGELLFRFPSLEIIFKILASGYMIYLAFKFFKAAKVDKVKVKAPSFKDGVILELLNFKFMMVPMVIFSQFLDPDSVRWVQILTFTLILNSTNMTGHFVWISLGEILTKKVNTPTGMKLQSYFFGSLLIAVAVWMFLN